MNSAMNKMNNNTIIDNNDEMDIKQIILDLIDIDAKDVIEFIKKCRNVKNPKLLMKFITILMLIIRIIPRCLYILLI